MTEKEKDLKDLVGVSPTAVDAESATVHTPITACEDCGLPYLEFPLDVVLPDADWLAIHPKGDGGLLCAQCITTRASRLPRMIIVYARLVRDDDHDAFRAVKNAKWDSFSPADLCDLFDELRRAEQAMKVISPAAAGTDFYVKATRRLESARGALLFAAVTHQVVTGNQTSSEVSDRFGAQRKDPTPTSVTGGRR